jgi:hypothetical protein
MKSEFTGSVVTMSFMTTLAKDGLRNSEEESNIERINDRLERNRVLQRPIINKQTNLLPVEEEAVNQTPDDSFSTCSMSSIDVCKYLPPFFTDSIRNRNFDLLV